MRLLMQQDADKDFIYEIMTEKIFATPMLDVTFYNMYPELFDEMFMDKFSIFNSPVIKNYNYAK